jgi:diguanylate cyclase (GGDEF)-like protein
MLTRRSLTPAFAALLVFVCAALLAISGWRSLDARRVQIGEMDTATGNLARAMAQQADFTLHEADLVTGGLVERIETDGTSPKALARLHRFMSSESGRLPQLNGLFIYDEHGAWIVTSQPVLHTELNNADREYFIYHRTHPEDKQVHIGQPIVSRSTQQWIIPVSRRIDHADGSFAGVALATVNISYFQDFYDTLDIGHNGAIAMIYDNGTMAVRRPYATGAIGKDMRHADIYQAFLAHNEASNIEVQSSQDDVVRLNSYRPLKRYPLFVAAALSKDEVLADWRRSAVVNLGGTALLVLLVGLVGTSLIRQMSRRAGAERELDTAYKRLEQANQVLHNQATHDGLTGLGNRHHFDMTLADEFRRAQRSKTSLALILIDLDHFKQYNDCYGHVAGDQCLRSVSDLIRGELVGRPGDLIARYGGEEIVILLPDTGLDAAYWVAEHVRNAIVRSAIVHRGNEVGVVTISAGVCAWHANSDIATPEALIEGADQALYAAKRAGRNRVARPPLRAATKAV